MPSEGVFCPVVGMFLGLVLVLVCVGVNDDDPRAPTGTPLRIQYVKMYYYAVQGMFRLYPLVRLRRSWSDEYYDSN